MTWTLVVIALLNGQRSAAQWSFDKPYICARIAADLLRNPKVEAAWCDVQWRS